MTDARKLADMIESGQIVVIASAPMQGAPAGTKETIVAALRAAGGEAAPSLDRLEAFHKWLDVSWPLWKGHQGSVHYMEQRHAFYAGLDARGSSAAPSPKVAKLLEDIEQGVLGAHGLTTEEMDTLRGALRQAAAPVTEAKREDFIQVSDTLDVAECCVHDQIKNPLEREETQKGLKRVRELALSALRGVSATEGIGGYVGERTAGEFPQKKMRNITDYTNGDISEEQSK